MLEFATDCKLALLNVDAEKSRFPENPVLLKQVCTQEKVYHKHIVRCASGKRDFRGNIGAKALALCPELCYDRSEKRCFTFLVANFVASYEMQGDLNAYLRKRKNL